MKAELYYKFSTNNQDIDLKLIPDTDENKMKKYHDLHMSKLKVTARVKLVKQGTVISQKFRHKKLGFFFFAYRI